MLDEKKHTHHFGTPSLLPLKIVLINAEKELPPRLMGRKKVEQQKDVNEELALKLIERMKKEHKKSHPFAGRLWIENATAKS